jgi:hypothetical protein
MLDENSLSLPESVTVIKTMEENLIGTKKKLIELKTSDVFSVFNRTSSESKDSIDDDCIVDVENVWIKTDTMMSSSTKSPISIENIHQASSSSPSDSYIEYDPSIETPSSVSSLNNNYNSLNDFEHSPFNSQHNNNDSDANYYSPQTSSSHDGRIKFSIYDGNRNQIYDHTYHHSQSLTNILQQSSAPFFAPETFNAAPANQKYFCKICSREFKTDSNLQRHLRSKTHERKVNNKRIAPYTQHNPVGNSRLTSSCSVMDISRPVLTMTISSRSYTKIPHGKSHDDDEDGPMRDTNAITDITPEERDLLWKLDDEIWLYLEDWQKRNRLDNLALDEESFQMTPPLSPRKIEQH